MTSVGKLIRRFVGILVLSMFLLFVVNVVILLAVASTQTPGIGPWTTAQETEAGLQLQTYLFCRASSMKSTYLHESVLLPPETKPAFAGRTLIIK